MQLNKYKKYHRQTKIGKNEKETFRNVKKGYYGLKTKSFGLITPKQLETARRALSRITKRTGKIFINIFCNHPITKKPLLSRMGKGAGSINCWVAYVKKGKIIIEAIGSKKLIFMAFRVVQYRIAIKMHIIKREVIDV
jgi:large subunit ribosomal protein L16